MNRIVNPIFHLLVGMKNPPLITRGNGVLVLQLVLSGAQGSRDWLMEVKMSMNSRFSGLVKVLCYALPFTHGELGPFKNTRRMKTTGISLFLNDALCRLYVSLSTTV